MTGVPAKCPSNLPIRVLLDLLSLGQATSDFWLPFRCFFRQRADQGPEGQKFNLQWILHYLKKSFWSPKPTLVLDWAAFWPSERDSHSADLGVFGAFQTLGWGGVRGGGGRGDLNGGSGDRRKEAPPEIKGPGRNRGSGAALSPTAAIHKPACSAKSSPATTSSGPSGEGGIASGSVPLA